MSIYFLYLIVLRGAHCALFELTCEETKMRITANVDQVTPLLRSGGWRLQLGDDHAAQRGPSCRAAGPGPGPGIRTGGLPIVIHAGLQECGTESTVRTNISLYNVSLFI